MMLYTKRSLGIVADNTNQRVSIFNTRTLQALQHIPLNADVLGVALTNDCSRAVVSSFISKMIFQIDLSGREAEVVGSVTGNTLFEDIALTPDGRFALSTDGAAENQDIASYSLGRNAIVSSMPADAQSVAISPKGNGLVLTTVDSAKSVHWYKLNYCGGLIDSKREVSGLPYPVNVNFSPDGNFAFVSNYAEGGVSVLSTAQPNRISLIGTVGGLTSQSMAVASDGRILFVLGPDLVSIYAFDPVTGYLSLQRSFPHGLSIQLYYGVDQIALDASETRLFVSGVGEVAVFTTYGARIGTVADASGPGGLAICPCAQISYPDC